MRKPVVLALVLGLAACAAPADDRVVDRDWQAIGIYTAPGASSAVPPQAPSISFSKTGAVGTTGCSRFVADVDFHDDAVRFDSVTWGEQSPNCDGQSAWAHNTLTKLFVEGNDFTVAINPNDQLILTLRDGKVDSPAVRFVAL